jgi:hypothetical protein
MNKRRLHHFYTKFRLLNTKVIVVLLIISSIITLLSLRQNNLTAIKLRDSVLSADEKGGDTEKALRVLRQYTYSHMNTDLTSGASSVQHPVQLKFTYDRLVQAEKDRVSKVNEKIYAEAQAICEKRFPIGLSGSGRIPCIEDYVSQNGTREQPIQDSLYKYNFVSPQWSPDLAGISLVVSVFLLILLIGKLIADRYIKNQLSSHL